MYGFISHELYAEQIKKAVGQDVIFEAVGTFSDDDLIKRFEAAGRIAIDTLIVHTDCAEDRAVLKGIRSYLIQRPHTRIVIVAPDRKLGDKLISSIVHLGIYDIVATQRLEDEDEILVLPDLYKMLKKEKATYADAARWDYDFEKQQENVQMERVVMRERLVGTSTIALTTAGVGVDSTYMGLQIAQYLRQFGNEVVFAELLSEGENWKSRLIPLMEEDTYITNKVFRIPEIKGVDLVSTTKMTDIIRHKNYDYIVLDVGPLNVRDSNGNFQINQHIGEIERATIGAVLASGTPWGYMHLLDFIEGFGLRRPEWDILLQFPSEQQYDRIYKDITEKTERYNIHNVPYQPNPFRLEYETEKMLQEFLLNIVPTEIEEKKGFLNRLGLGRNLVKNRGR